MICTNDCLIVLGSIIKQLIESKSVIGDMWDICRFVFFTTKHYILLKTIKMIKKIKTIMTI